MQWYLTHVYIRYMPFLPNLGATEWIIIAVLVLVLFGSKKLTELARGLGESGKELKRAKKEFQTAKEEIREDNTEGKKEDK